MAFLSKTYVDGPLLVKDTIALTPEDVHIASFSKGSIILGSEHYPLNIQSKDLEMTSKGEIITSADGGIALNTKQDLNLSTDDKLVFRAKTLVLQNTSDNCLYGVADPNDLILPNVAEGTMYFKLAIE